MRSHPILSLKVPILLGILMLSVLYATAQCSVNAGSDQTICSGQSVIIGGAPTASGGSGVFTYDWISLPPVQDIANPTVSPTSSITYTVTVNDGAGCIVTDDVTITVNATPVANAGADIDPCLNSPSITMGGGGIWSGAAPTMLTPAGIFTPNLVGTYNLTLSVTSNGCTGSDQRTVQVRPLPVTNAGVDQTICQGQTVQLGATATSANGVITLYTWSGGSVSNPLSQNPTATPNNTTTYNVTAVDIEGCSKPDQITVTVNSNPVVNAGPDISLCSDPVPTQLTGSSPNGGTWSGTGVTAGGIFTPPGTGNFTLTYSYTNATGCSALDTRIVNVINAGTIDAGPDVSACIGAAAVQLIPVTSGGAWSGSSYVTSNGIFTPSAVGSYTLTYTINMGTCNSTDQIVFTVNALPVVNAGFDFAVCAGSGSAMNATVSGGQAPYGYTWSPSTGLSANNVLNPIATPSSTTTYTLTSTDFKGCSASDAVIVSINNLPVVDAGADISFCSNASPTQLSGQTPSGGTFSGTGVSASGIFTPSTTGNFTITYSYTNGQGCTATDTRVVSVVSPQVINGGPDVSICLNTSPVQLSPITAGGTWSGSTSVTSGGLFNPTTSGTFNLTYSLTSGVCTSTDAIFVTVHTLPTVNAGSDAQMCAGSSVNLVGTASGTLAPYTPIWSPSAGLSSTNTLTTTASPASTSTYTLSVVDGYNCSASDNVVVTVNALPIVNAGLDIALCNSPTPTQLTGNSPMGGTFSGAGVTSTGVFTPSSIGSFNITYTYTDPNLCSASDTRIVNVVAPSPVDGGADIGICQNAPSFNMNPITPNGTWSGSAFITSAGVFTPSTVGTYSLTYSVNTGVCISTDQVIVTVYALPTINAGSDMPICAGSSATLNAIAQGGFGSYGYQWTPATDLSSSTIANPIANPLSTINYTVTVTDGHNCTASDAVQVIVNAIPVVNAGADVAACNQSIPMTLQSATPVGGTWTGTGVTPNGVYTPSAVGSYPLTYSFTNSGGCTSSDQLVVTVGNAPTINAGPDQTMCLNSASIVLSNNTSSTGTWTGNGITNATSGAFDPASSGAGSHTITLSDGTGTCAVSDQVQILVNSLPVVSAGTNQTICGNSAIVTLTGTNPTTGTWTGPGIVAQNPGQFNPGIGNGSYSLMYSYTNNSTGCSNTAYKTIVVAPVPSAAFTTPTQACLNAPISLTNNSIGATTYTWTFGDNSGTISGFTPAHSYSTTGSFPVVMSASNASGCSSTANASILIVAPPVAGMQLSANNGCEPLTVQFSNTTVGSQTTYNWDMATGTTSAMIPANQVYYASNGISTYNVSLIANNFCGSSTVAQVITVYPKPQADFDLNVVSTICSPVEVEFQNSSIGNPDATEWDFGNGAISGAPNPGTNIYITGSTPTDYTIWLYVENECGTDSVFEVIQVQPNSVNAAITPSTSQGCTPLEVDIQNASQGASSFTYYVPQFGWTSNQNQPQFTFTQDGNFDIYLYATDGCGFDTTMASVSVLPSPDVDFVTDVQFGCEEGDVVFQAISVNSNNFHWDFGDGDYGTNMIELHNFEEAGDYDVTLTGTALNQCQTAVTHNFEVFENPVADFTIPNSDGCSPMQACFSNASVGATYYVWDFGNGITTSETNPCYSFENTSADIETHTVSLHVMTDQLCQDVYSMDLVVQPIPESDFILPEESSCSIPVDVNPMLTILGGNNYQWFLDNLLFSTNPIPSMTIDALGVHTFSLVTTNGYGCTDTTTRVFQVFQAPVADLSASPTSGCLDLDVQFQNNSTNSTSYLWTFSDGSASTSLSPMHTFNQQGVFDVTLQVTSPDGCTDEISFPNMIQTFELPVASFTMTPEETSIYLPEIEFTNTSEEGVTFSWNFGDGTTSNLENPVHEYESPGVWPITLTIGNMFGCTDKTMKYVTINNDFLVFIPNAFTPDNDGLNDVFKPELSNTLNVETYSFIVIDRWGKVIFETDNPEMGWMGNVNGGTHYAENGAYTYRMVLNTDLSTEVKELKGQVTLLR